MANDKQRFTLRGFDQDNDPVFYDQHTGKTYVVSLVTRFSGDTGYFVYCCGCGIVEGSGELRTFAARRAPPEIESLIAPMARALSLAHGGAHG